MPAKGTSTKVPRVCRQCSADFLAWPYKVKEGKAWYCRPSCRYASLRAVPSEIETLSDGTARIPLYARDGSIRAYALVDAADAEWANQWRWHRSAKGYAIRGVHQNGRLSFVRMHRELLGLPRKTDGREGDHIDRDKMNCRRSNLRPLTKAENSQNLSSFSGATSEYRGVCWDKDTGEWRAQVGSNGKTYRFGRFKTEEEAASAAREGRKRLLPFAVD